MHAIKNGYLMAIIHSSGAELTSLIGGDGTEYIWQRDPYYWTGSAPVLFPIVGNLRDKKTIINNKTYQMGTHGFLRNQQFEVLQKKSDTVSFVNIYSNETLAQYPFKYKVIVTYKLRRNRLITKYLVINEYEEKLPFNIGGHPGFNCPIFPGESFTDYRIIFEFNETFSSPKVEKNGTLNFDVAAKSYYNIKVLPLSYDLFDVDTIIIPRIKSKTVSLLNAKQKGIIFHFTPFITFALWSPPGKRAPFICLEPWIGYGDRHDTDYNFIGKDNIVILNNLEEFGVSYEIEITQ